MWQFLKNLFSYLHFVLSFNRFQLASAIIDILILGYSIANPEKVTSHPSVIVLFLGVFVDFVWQIINVIGHFSFLKMEDPKLPLVSSALLTPMAISLDCSSSATITPQVSASNPYFALL